MRKSYLLVLLLAVVLALCSLQQVARADSNALTAGGAEESSEEAASVSASASSASDDGDDGDDGEEGEDEEEDSDDSDEDTPDMVANMIDALREKLKEGSFKTGGAKIMVVDNSNVAHHDEVDHAKTDKQKARKTQEEQKKEHREGSMKRADEQQQKAMENVSKKKIMAIKLAVRKEQIAGEKSVDQKILSEQKEKSDEANRKKAFEATTKKQVELANQRTSEAGRKGEAEMEKKRVAEVNAKKAAEGKNKKHIANLKKAAQNRNKAAKKKKKNRKNRKKKRGKNKRNKKNRRVSTVSHCDCRNVRAYFQGYNRWIMCPSGTLLTGMYRNGRDDLYGIYYYRCCRPCEKRGRRVVRRHQVTNCYNANWGRSFDRRGWSWCKNHYFVRGFYRSRCNHIYCLEHAQCCTIRGRRGNGRQQSCNNQGGWGRSLDRAGWSRLSGNKFMRGLYRSSGQRLHNIEYPHQCGFRA